MGTEPVSSPPTALQSFFKNTLSKNFFFPLELNQSMLFVRMLQHCELSSETFHTIRTMKLRTFATLVLDVPPQRRTLRIFFAAFITRKNTRLSFIKLGHSF